MFYSARIEPTLKSFLNILYPTKEFDKLPRLIEFFLVRDGKMYACHSQMSYINYLVTRTEDEITDKNVVKFINKYCIGEEGVTDIYLGVDLGRVMEPIKVQTKGLVDAVTKENSTQNKFGIFGRRIRKELDEYNYDISRISLSKYKILQANVQLEALNLTNNQGIEIDVYGTGSDFGIGSLGKGEKRLPAEFPQATTGRWYVGSNSTLGTEGLDNIEVRYSECTSTTMSIDKFLMLINEGSIRIKRKS